MRHIDILKFDITQPKKSEILVIRLLSTNLEHNFRNAYPFRCPVRLSCSIVIALTLQSLSAKNCSISFLSALKCTFFKKTLRLSRSSCGFAEGVGSAVFGYYSSAPWTASLLSGLSASYFFSSSFYSSFLSGNALLSDYTCAKSACTSAYIDG